ncbi:outer membrane lipoprotein carrier protein LolA [Actinokineospora sp. PR83]|uniref:LolA family protein n=1 Tax=Actinokineospora sp. PR83 TaxID=2884908 RepID=UPI001F214717|nr:sigma-E factor regulatory protein RseB domain-containing protein [Actinokineospora sp. PR83]MCG8916805.1 outer membrane lipoprotein carrier protein LolA [Actinokineospora sp. PR83]
MNRKRTALSVAAAGTATGVVGLVLLAAPAGADEAPPTLPEVSAEALVQSVLTSDVPALSGTVRVSTDLGLPVPGLPTGDEAVRVYTDGQGKARISMDQGRGEKTVIADGATTWLWNSADRSVVKYDSAAEHKADRSTEEKLADPAAVSLEFITAMRADSTVSVDGTAKVADRPAYQLVLTPKPTERTLLREVRVAVDSETRLPLRLEVMANGSAEPALSVGFTEFATGAQDAGLFTFTPPAGAEVTDGNAKARENKPTEQQKKDFLATINPKVVGEGWDTVLVGTVPADLLKAEVSGEDADGRKAAGTPLDLLKQFGKPVSGPFGTGFVITTKVGTALVAEDGRVAVGAVPQQVLVDALGQK